jgi:hypothetical protein
LTTSALFAGFYAVVAAMDSNFEKAAIAIFIAMFMDGLDGRVARLTSTESDFGKEYDSLADMVSFGLAPALVVYEWGGEALREIGWAWGKFGWLAAFSMPFARRFAWPATTPSQGRRTSVSSRACPARRRPPWWQHSSGSAPTTTLRVRRPLSARSSSPRRPAR